jgi:hypothetical protein
VEIRNINTLDKLLKHTFSMFNIFLLACRTHATKMRTERISLLTGILLLIISIIFIIQPVVIGQVPLGKTASSSAAATIVSRDQVVEMRTRDTLSVQFEMGYSSHLSDTIILSRHLHYLILNCE